MDPTMQRGKINRGKYRIYEDLENQGYTSLRDIKVLLQKMGLTNAPTQYDYWLVKGFIKESDFTAERRKKMDKVPRYFDYKEVQKIAYLSLLINECGLNLNRAAKLAEMLVENKAKDGYHWIQEKNLLIRIPELKVYT